MKKISHFFGQRQTDYLFDAALNTILSEFDKDRLMVITDENVYSLHAEKINGFNKIIIAPGEASKIQPTVDGIIQKLAERKADKNSVLVGLGGGVVTDIAGYAASVYKRGIQLIHAPTSLLGMVDAAIGGKNGVNIGNYKNIVGTVYQPQKIIFDFSFLQTLPKAEWINGFAETIKHACIKDAALFALLEGKTPVDFMTDKALAAALVEQNVAIKTKLVLADEFETGERKLLNFGHTLGHAIENIHQLPHGHAVSIGMAMACKISEQLNLLSTNEKERVLHLLQRYELPVHFSYDKDKAWQALLMDKKRDKEAMNFILLTAIGEGIISSLPLSQLKNLL